MSPNSLRADPWFWATLALLAAVRLAAIAIYDGEGFPDRFNYLAYSDEILSGTEWLRTVAADPLSMTAFRAPGYPILLAGVRAVSDTHHVLILQLLQTTAMLGACAATYGVAARLLPHRWMAAVSVCALGLSVALAYEMSILADSLSIAAWVALVAIGARHWLDGTRPSWTGIAGLAILALVIVSVRGNGIHLVLLTLPVLGAALIAGAGPGRGIAKIAAVLLPGVVLYLGAAEWNRARTGEAFFTTGAQIAMVQPTFEMARRGADAFNGDDPVSVAARAHAPTLDYGEIYEINRILYVERGMTQKQIADANVALYLKTVFGHPGAFVSMWFGNFDDKLAIGLLNPAFGLQEAHQLQTGERLVPGFSKIVKRGEGGPIAIVYAIVYGVLGILSVVVFAAGILIAPILAARRIRGDDNARVLLSLWLVSFAAIAYYGALFVELRYLIMTTPFITILGIWTLWRAVSARRDRL